MRWGEGRVRNFALTALSRDVLQYRSCDLKDIQGDRYSVERIGGVFVCTGDESKHQAKWRSDVYNISPFHGRSALYESDGEYVYIKGTGWTFGGASVVTSPKDPGLVFGLYDKKFAEREFEVSKVLNSHGIRACRVLGYGSLEEVSHSNVEAAQLFVSTLYPLRVADLSFVPSLDIREKFVEDVARLCKLSKSTLDYFVYWFVESLSGSIIQLHSMGGACDSLTYDNVTLAGELVDFEWLFVPGIPTPDGNADIFIEERQKKAAIYTCEIGFYLANFLDVRITISQLAKHILSKHREASPFTETLETLVC